MKKLKLPLICISGLFLIIFLSFSFHHRNKELNENPSDSKWKCIGPYGQKLHYAPGSYYSGRINEIEI